MEQATRHVKTTGSALPKDKITERAEQLSPLFVKKYKGCRNGGD
jgi:hypothetical protein